MKWLFKLFSRDGLPAPYKLRKLNGSWQVLDSLSGVELARGTFEECRIFLGGHRPLNLSWDDFTA